jgi:hypothetical protein
MCQGLNWNRKRPCKTKVTELNVPLLSDKNVLRLQISVQDSLGMAVIDSEEQLLHHFLDLLPGYFLALFLVFPHVLLQVILCIFKYQMELLYLRLKDHID